LKGGTGKAEDAKLQDAGISPKQCPGKGVAEKEWTYRAIIVGMWNGRKSASTTEDGSKISYV
jgi:hypothetical protein